MLLCGCYLCSYHVCRLQVEHKGFHRSPPQHTLMATRALSEAHQGSKDSADTQEVCPSPQATILCCSMLNSDTRSSSPPAASQRPSGLHAQRKATAVVCVCGGAPK